MSTYWPMCLIQRFYWTVQHLSNWTRLNVMFAAQLVVRRVSTGLYLSVWVTFSFMVPVVEGQLHRSFSAIVLCVGRNFDGMTTIKIFNLIYMLSWFDCCSNFFDNWYIEYFGAFRVIYDWSWVRLADWVGSDKFLKPCIPFFFVYNLLFKANLARCLLTCLTTSNSWSCHLPIVSSLPVTVTLPGPPSWLGWPTDSQPYQERSVHSHRPHFVVYLSDHMQPVAVVPCWLVLQPLLSGICITREQVVAAGCNGQSHWHHGLLAVAIAVSQHLHLLVVADNSGRLVPPTSRVLLLINLSDQGPYVTNPVNWETLFVCSEDFWRNLFPGQWIFYLKKDPTISIRFRT